MFVVVAHESDDVTRKLDPRGSSARHAKCSRRTVPSIGGMALSIVVAILLL